MRVFVFEYVTGGGYAGECMVSSLATEGDMMLTAMIRDLASIDGIEVLICRDRRFDAPAIPVEVVWIDSDWQTTWSQCVERADAVIPIAPETDRLLETLCRDVEQAGKLLLSSSAQAVELTASKQSTIEHLSAEHIPVVHSWRAVEAPPPEHSQTLVMKLDTGAGCEGMHLLPGPQAIEDFLSHQVNPESWVAQPYVEGRAASLSLLVGSDCMCLLGCNVQRIAQVDDSFMLLGCIVNGLDGPHVELVTLAKQLCDAVPGLWGYVGVDFILTETGPLVLEINPRLTTSYVGLSRSVQRNVAGLMLDLAEDPGHLKEHRMPGNPVHVDLELGRVA